MNLKKGIVMLLCVCVLAGLAACENYAGDGKETEAVTAETQAPETGQESTSAAVIEEIPEEAAYQYEMKELACENNGKNIYGVVYMPEREGKLPLVIYSHGLADTHESGWTYGQSLASHGIAVYCFDFCGGSPESKSDGETTDMSLMTEVSDLEAVLQAARSWDFVDPDKIVLLGASQGGAVTAVTAARHEQEVAGVILCYPALLLQENAHGLFTKKDAIPDTYYYLWLTVGRRYFEDVWDYDIYGEIGNYRKNVLILHGDQDTAVDISYSRRAAGAYENADFFEIGGGGHGFYEAVFDEAYGHILDYLRSQGII